MSPKSQIHLDIHVMGNKVVVIIEDDANPIPYHWAIIPKKKASFLDLESEPEMAWVYADASGEGITRNQIIEAISKVL